MSSTTFALGTVIPVDWLNGVNTLTYSVFNGASSVALARTALGLGTANSPVFTGLTLSGLTSGRIPLVSTSGLITDSSAITYSAGVITATGFTGALNGTLGATTPAAASVTTLIASGAITPSQTAGIVGTTTNNSADAGSVGEYKETILGSGSSVALTSAATSNVTSVSLTAGDWEVSGIVIFGGQNPTEPVKIVSGINTASMTMASLGTTARADMVLTGTPYATGEISQIVGPVRMSLAATTTVYILANSTFTAGTSSAYGQIRARRVR